MREDHRIDGPRHDLGRVLCFTSRCAHQFDCGISENHTRGDDHQLQYPGWQYAAVVGDDRYAGGLAVDGESARQEYDPDDQERHERDDLDQCGPKLHLPKEFH